MGTENETRSARPGDATQSQAPATVGDPAIDDALRRLNDPILLEPLPYGWVAVIWQDYARDSGKSRRDECETSGRRGE